MLEPEATDIINHGDTCNLSLDLPGHQLHEDIGRGIELLHRHSFRVPLTWTQGYYWETYLLPHPTKPEDINSSTKLVSFLGHGVKVVTPYSIQPKINKRINNCSTWSNSKSYVLWEKVWTKAEH